MTVKPLAFLFGLAVAATAAANSGPRKPAPEWVVHQDQARCLASRTYGTGEDTVILGLKAPPLGRLMQLIVVGSAKSGGGGTVQVPGEVRIGNGQSLQTSVLAFPSTDGKRRSYVMNLPSEHFAWPENADSISLQVSGGLDERLALDGMDSLIERMNACVAKLREVWNVPEDAVPVHRLREPAVGDLRGLVQADDYPWLALRTGADGEVEMVLLIDEAGRIADCTVMRSSNAVLSAQSCSILKKRARFKPAVGADGRPAKDTAIQRIKWVLR